MCIRDRSNTSVVKKDGSKKKKKKSKSKSKGKSDNLKRISGIGPKIEKLLHAAGINSFQEVATTPVERLESILDDAGTGFSMHSPENWAQQARLAAEGKWGQLKKLQSKFDKGNE